MGQGRTAYASFMRIHEEMDSSVLPDWESLSHVGRLAWEAAAQAVALQIVPDIVGSDYFDEDLEDESEDLELIERDLRIESDDDLGTQE